MLYEARIEVSLKQGHSDPEGEITQTALAELNYDVRKVKVGKVYLVLLRASSLRNAEETVDSMCRRLLANPVKDDYTISIVQAK